MALKTVHVTPHLNNLDHTCNNNHYYHNKNKVNQVVVHDHHYLDDHDDGDNTMVFDREFMVIGHRGAGMNLVQSDDPKMKFIKENTVLAFNAAGDIGVDFVEFDVQIDDDDDDLAVAAAIAVCKRLIVITFKVAKY
ncbi:glycerophosphodiester phosphodiesterase GDPD1, chloroplastic-like protein [Tanacetum coccineum]